jgi:hypothetical protein
MITTQQTEAVEADMITLKQGGNVTTSEVPIIHPAPTL